MVTTAQARSMVPAEGCTPLRAEQVRSPGTASVSTRESLGIYNTPEQTSQGPSSDTTSSSAEKLASSSSPPAIEPKLQSSAWMGSTSLDSVSKLPTPARSVGLQKQSDSPVPHTPERVRARSEEPDPWRGCSSVRRCCALPPAPEEDWLGGKRAPTTPVVQKQARDPQPAGPVSYKMSLDDPVGGIPTRSGELTLFDPITGDMKPWTVLLFSNGFYAVARSSGMVHSFAWSPFSVLHADRVHKAIDDETSFTLSILPHDMGFVFGSRAYDQKKDCKQWVTDMAKTLRTYTKSLFPPFALSVEPVESIPSTRNRIVAGYLLQEERDGTVIVVYCELQAHRNGKGMLMLYESERCDRFLSSVTINSHTSVKVNEGVDCSIFMVSVLTFCARSVEERSLWYRALDNVKVKCRNGAPDPTPEDLQSYRSAVLERVVRLELIEAAHRLGATAANPSPAVPQLDLRGIQAVQSGMGHGLQSNVLRCPAPRRKSCGAEMQSRGQQVTPVKSCSEEVAPICSKFPEASPRLRPARAPPAHRSLDRGDATGCVEEMDEGDLPHERSTPSQDDDGAEAGIDSNLGLPQERSAASRTTSATEEGGTSTPEFSMPATEKFMLNTPIREVTSAEDVGCEDVDSACHKPPISAPGPGLHEPHWLRPHPGAMRRVTDAALARLKDGVLSL